MDPTTTLVKSDRTKRQKRGTDMSHQGFCSSQPVGGQTQLLMLDGEFDLLNAPNVERAIDDAVTVGRNLVVDLRGVSYVDSTMMLALIRGLRLAHTRARGFALIRPNPLIWRIFVLTGLHRSLPAFAGLAEALASFDA
jgi:anti-sigma B factor antagonist